MEMMNWYKIPGFSSYDINYNTLEIRSCKHFNTGFHIMKVTSGKVNLVDDKGNSQRITVSDVFNRTFNMGYPLEPRGEYDMYCSGMQRINRKKKGSKYDTENRVTLTFGPNGIGTKPF